MKFTAEELFELTSLDGGRFKSNSVAEGYDFCRKLAVSHYENFPVASILLPKDQRHHVFAVYAFARIADDIADELTELEKEKRIEALIDYDEILTRSIVAGEDLFNPVFLALRHTMQVKMIPPIPFQKLLTAFRRDMEFKQPQSIADLTDYCFYSANPVGELVLRIFNIFNAKTSYFSDNICTALQMVNFWQDLSVDLQKGRLFIPDDILKKYGLQKENLHDKKYSHKLSKVLKELYDTTENFFETGKEIIQYLKPLRLKKEIEVTIDGGETILKKIRDLDVGILNKRPKLNKIDIFRIFSRSIIK